MANSHFIPLLKDEVVRKINVSAKFLG